MDLPFLFFDPGLLEGPVLVFSLVWIVWGAIERDRLERALNRRRRVDGQIEDIERITAAARTEMAAMAAETLRQMRRVS